MSNSLYVRVEHDILQRIQTGIWPVGTQLPKEDEMASQLGISRSTLRLAYASLHEKGILERKKRSGTRVIADKPANRFRMVTGGLNDVLSLGRDTKLRISGTRNVKTRDVALLEGQESVTGFWLEITGTRHLDEKDLPFNWSQIYVTGQYAGIEPALGTEVGSVFSVIEETFDIKVARVDQRVFAIGCPEEPAKAMGLKAGDPAIHIRAGLYDADDNLLEVSSAIFDPQRFHIRTDVRIQ
ncbi:GntR family transcriptional regulator [Hoeflea prorocentri]|uniref:GntR family transcriptional regulator n=1 Tax=Hoeflea prorocentri TaxID=1922333 RepID=A0A9X3UIX8_9HYPH|nr:GntR family transcriptional regulator [Hoeflea prorocentri]MCY6381683.1 GntR family transcriptional regulator [Hoeflea prorocentri]MDA5399483.1 GntR family transcriptional regulator [Hoeflea prorocentri]